MVTTQSLREFAAHCLVWVKSTNASNRQTIVDAARSWTSIADALDRAENLPDLRNKLN